MKILVIFFLFISIPCICLGQDNGRQIAGKVLMLDGETPHVSLVMQAIQNETILQTILTDDKGEFKFAFSAAGLFRIRIHMLKGYSYYHKDRGYTTLHENGSILRIDSNQKLSVGTILLPRFIKGKVKIYHPVDGLADTYCTCIYRDPRGQMWFGTEGGFSFFENGRLKSVNMGNGLPNSWVNCMVAINEKDMLIGTQGGLTKYNWQTKVLQEYKNEEFLGENITALIKSQNGDILIGIDDTVYSLDNRGQIIKLFSLPEQITQNNKEPQVTVSISGLVKDKNGTVWISTKEWDTNSERDDPGRLFKYKGNNISKWEFIDKNLDARVNQMMTTKDGSLWLATTQGLIKIGGKGDYKQYTIKDGLFSNEVSVIYESSDSSIWIGYYTYGSSASGHRRHRISRLAGERIIHVIKVDNYCRAIKSSADGQMWVGTAGNGLLLYDDLGVVSYKSTDNFPNGTVSGIKSIHQNKIWVLLSPQWPANRRTTPAIYSIDSESNQVHILDVTKELVPSNIELDSDGNLLILSNQGLFKYDGQLLKKLSQKVFSSVTLSQDKKVWLYNSEENLLSKFDKGQVIHAKEVNVEGLQSFQQIWPRLILVENNNFWFGSFKRGLYRSSDNVVSNFLVKDGFGSPRVFCALPTHDNGIWFGTWRIRDGIGGISIYKNGGFSSLTTTNGLSQDIVFDISQDNTGRIWMATWGGGVSLYDGVSWSVIDTSDGLDSGYIKSIHADNVRNVWIGSKDGLFRYRLSYTKPKAFIKKVFIGDSVYIYPTDEINVKIGQRITITNESVDYKTSVNKIQYRHRLLQNGFGVWNATTHDSTYNFTPRGEGKYEFQVTSVDRDLNYSEPKKLIFLVSQHWYLKKSFIYPAVFFSTVILLTATFFGVKYYQNKSESRRLEIEAQNLRDQMLADLTQELEEARQMQFSLLPESAPNISNLEISGRNIGAKEVGGDFFDYLTGKENQLMIAVGDVSGKGLKGAMNAVMASGILRLATDENPTSNSSVLMDKVNKSLCQSMEQDMNVTMVLAQFDMQNNKMTLANAGQHAYPLLKRGSSLETVKAKGLALGMIPSIPYKPITVDFQLGDLFLFMTDGITEPRNAEGLMYEESGRFHQVLSELPDELNAEEVVENIIQDVLDYMVDGEERDDDITLVAVKVT